LDYGTCLPSPVLFILAGPNGAGKTTLFDMRLSPRLEKSVEFVDPDRLILGAIGRPALTLEESRRGQAMADRRRDTLFRVRRSFVTESTFSHPSKLDLIAQARSLGYKIVVYHVGVANPDISVSRVAARVGEGGHPVPEDKIRARYERNRELIRAAVLGADLGFVLDNSRLNDPLRIIFGFQKGSLSLADPNPPAWASVLYGGHSA
jgi:predicted ABC-type ATPase